MQELFTLLVGREYVKIAKPEKKRKRDYVQVPFPLGGFTRSRLDDDFLHDQRSWQLPVWGEVHRGAWSTAAPATILSGPAQRIMQVRRFQPHGPVVIITMGIKVKD